MSVQKILIVEDDKHILRLVTYNLEKAGFKCLSSATGEDGLKLAQSYPPDLVVLDIMLPGMDGFEFCRRLRADAALKNVPVLILTARGEEVDRIVGLELGADDYMVKPFSPRELILRIKAILRRGRPGPVTVPAPEAVLKIKGLCVDIARHKVNLGKREAVLTPMEFKLLVTLIERRGRVQTRERLLSDVWGIDASVTTRTVDTHVKRLRAKIGPAGRLIETIRGVGYRIREDA
ncbi:MAG: response regulator [Deltaproteobacteria bacterium]